MFNKLIENQNLQRGMMGEQFLYNNVQGVIMPDGKNKDLRVNITCFGKPTSKVELRLTDDEDPSLLYVLHVSEADFNVIKAQQGLLVEFSHFPVHLVKLLEQCLNSVKGFLLMLEECGLESYLKVVQPIDLKNLCYIALRITRGSETEVMRHMRNEIINVKTLLISKEDECKRLLKEISQLQNSITAAEQQAENKIMKGQEELKQIKAHFSQEKDALRDQMLQERRRELDSAAYECERLKTKVDDLTKELSKYKTKHIQMCEKYEMAQQAVRDLNNRNSALEDKQKILIQELGELRHRISELETDCRKKDQECGQSHSRAEALDKEVARLRSRLSRQEEQLREADTEQVRLKSALSRLQETTEARSDLVLQLNGDLTKANLIIKERQKEIEKMHGELQRLVSNNSQNEHQIANLKLEMKLLHANAERDDSRIKELETAERKLQQQLKEANELIAAKDEQHKKCGDLIAYLNRSLNRQQLDPSPPSTAQGVSMPTLHMSAPSAPILYTMGTSLGRAAAAASQVQNLHMSGPQIGSLPKSHGSGPPVSARPFSSTPLVVSAAAGGTGVTTRRSFPGAMTYPRNQLQQTDGETPARSVVDRTAFSQARTNTDRNSHSKIRRGSNNQERLIISNSKSESNVQRPVAPCGTTIQTTFKGKKPEKSSVLTSDKENKIVDNFKPSAYFQPNKIRTDF